MTYMETEIVKYGKELAAINPDSKELKFARTWWAEGRPVKYSNQDFDVLNMLVGALSQAKMGK